MGMFERISKFLRKYRWLQSREEFEVEVCTDAAPAALVEPATEQDGVETTRQYEEASWVRWLLVVEVDADPGETWSVLLAHRGYVRGGWCILGPDEGRLNDGIPLFGVGPKRYVIGVQNIALFNRYALVAETSEGAITVTAALIPSSDVVLL